MVRSRNRRGRRAGVAGVRTAWRVVSDGEFFCPGCGGDRCYQRQEGRRRLTLLGVPLLARGAPEQRLTCVVCSGHFAVAALETPTTTRLTTMLRDAVHTIAIAVLAAGGSERPAAREAAVATVREAGFRDCTEERLLTLLAALCAEGTPAVEAEVREALSTVAPHLGPSGRESLLLRGARIALADGPYRAAESSLLATIGTALRLTPPDTERLLTGARTAG